MPEEKVIIDNERMNRMLARLAHEIIEQNPEEESVYLVGIKRRGVPIASRLKENIEKFSGIHGELGELDITLYRDDLSERFPEPHLNSTVIPFDVAGKRIILVDDVLFTGRTARAAIDALFSMGRPALIQLAILVDRGHRELPIRGDYIGKNVPTSKTEHIEVKIPPFEDKIAVELYG